MLTRVNNIYLSYSPIRTIYCLHSHLSRLLLFDICDRHHLDDTIECRTLCVFVVILRQKKNNNKQQRVLEFVLGFMITKIVI